MDESTRKEVEAHTKMFQNYLIKNGTKLTGGADGIFGMETFMVAIKVYEKLKQK